MLGSAAFRASVVPGGALAGPWVRNELWRRARAVPSLDLRFAENKSLTDAVSGQSLVTFTRASSGTYVGSDGLLKTATTNEPRFDHKPTTGESLGLLVEEQRTNSIRNNTMVGAVAGTPGTAPTNWTMQTSTSGLSRTIVGTGTENGITYIDVQYSGTTTGAISGAVIAGAEANTQVAASSGQTWTASWYVKLAGGSTSGISQLTQQVTERDAAGAIVSGSTSTTSILTTVSTAPLVQQRITQTRTLNGATTAFVTGEIRLSAPTATAIDFTLRIGLPQLEQGAFATSAIPTTGTAATRSADVASITGANFSSWYRQGEGTILFDGVNPAVSTTSFAISDGSTNNRIQMDSGTNTRIARVVSGGATQASNSVAYTYGSSQRFALSYVTDAINFANAGALGTEDTTATVPTVDQLRLGTNPTGANPLNSAIRRLTFWPARLSNSTLQAITQ